MFPASLVDDHGFQVNRWLLAPPTAELLGCGGLECENVSSGKVAATLGFFLPAAAF